MTTKMISKMMKHACITKVKNRNKKYWARTVPFILFFLCISTVYAPTLAQFHPPPCPAKFDKDSYVPGDTVTIYGTVVHGDTPVEGANVIVDTKDFGLGSLEAETDSNGNWTLSFDIPEDQEFGNWPIEVSITQSGGDMMYMLAIQVGEVETEGPHFPDEVPSLIDIEILKTQNAELEAEKQMLQGRIQELEEEIQSLQETSSGVSYGTLGIVVSGVVVICLAVFAIMYQRSSQRSNRPAM